jgi:1-deoxy-D-xylulose-5-phosphate synthase
VFGTLLATAMEVADEFDATVLDMRFVAPLDAVAVKAAAEQHGLLVTIEDNVVTGGAGSAVNECLLAAGCSARVVNLGLPACFTEHGTREEILRGAGLDAQGLRRTIATHIEAITRPAIAG